MKTVAVVPIKLNNERLPGKNTKCFDNGKPLVTLVLETLKKVKNIDEIYCYCSNNDIEEYLPEDVRFLKRDKSLDLSTTSITEVLLSFANTIESDVYILVHATAPFITSYSIEKGVESVLSGKYDSSLAVRRLQEFLWKDGEPFNYSLENIPRTQDLAPVFCETSGFFVYTRELILNYHRRVGFNPYLVEVSKIEATDIDEQEDFEIANAIFNGIIKDIK